MADQILFYLFRNELSSNFTSMAKLVFGFDSVFGFKEDRIQSIIQTTSHVRSNLINKRMILYGPLLKVRDLTIQNITKNKNINELF